MSRVNMPKLESIHIEIKDIPDSKEERIKQLLAIAIANYIEIEQELV